MERGKLCAESESVETRIDFKSIPAFTHAHATQHALAAMPPSPFVAAAATVAPTADHRHTAMAAMGSGGTEQAAGAGGDSGGPTPMDTHEGGGQPLTPPHLSSLAHSSPSHAAAASTAAAASIGAACSHLCHACMHFGH